MTDVALDTAARTLQRGRTRAWRGAVLPMVLLSAWTIVPHLLPAHPLLVPLGDVLAAPFIDESGREIWSAICRTALNDGLMRRSAKPDAPANRPNGASLAQTLLRYGETTKIVFIALSAFFPVALNTHDGLRTIAKGYMEVAAVLKLSPGRRVLKLLLPGALPSIFIGLQIGLITAWLGTVGGEYMIGVGRGLGIFIAEARGQFRMDLVLLGVVFLALIGFLANLGFRRLSEPLIHWQGTKR